MLVLTRKYQEKIRIGENITITVLRMKGKAVRLGIEAPSNVPVVRGELSFMGAEEAASADGVEAPTLEIEIEEVDRPVSGRTFGRQEGMPMAWPTDSKPDGGSRGQASTTGAKVGFARVSRDKVADLLPRLAGEASPLRAMMKQRS